jgi:hypothetical protein
MVLLIPAASIWSPILGPTWDRRKRAEALETYEMMKVKASIKRTPVGKPDPIDPERREWRYIATIKITNADSEPHLVSVLSLPIPTSSYPGTDLASNRSRLTTPTSSRTASRLTRQ